QPEPWEHARIEAGQGTDPFAGKGEDEEAGPVSEAAHGGAEVGPERRLTIRPGRHEVMSAAAHEGDEEAGHDVATLVFEGNGRHGDADLGGKHGDQRVDIAGLPCTNELHDERTLGA